MIDFVFLKLQVIVDYVSFPIVQFLILFLGLYIFWRDSKMTKKNKNSVFDMFFVTSLLMIIWGRIMYIILNLADYTDLPWSISPYERYADGVFFFRLLPWKYFAIWDGGVLYIPMFVTFVIIATVYALLIKKWRIREILGTIIIPSTFLISTTFLAIGFYSDEIMIFKQGLFMFIFVCLYQVVQSLLSFFLKKNHDTFFKSYFIISIISHVLISVYVAVSLLNSPITSVDQIHLYLFIVWSIVTSVIFAIDMSRDSGVKEIHIKSKQITPNVPIRINGNK